MRAAVDAEIVSVVNAMVTGAASVNSNSIASNQLKAQLDQKLTVSPTCQCFDPAGLRAVNATLGASLQNVQADTAALQTTVRAMNSSLLTSIQTTASTLQSSLQTTNTTLTSALQTSTLSLQSQMQNTTLSMQSSLQTVNASLQSLTQALAQVNTTLGTSLNNLVQQSAFFVDTRSLSVIDAQVGTVVARLASAPAGNNTLAAQLASKLTSSATCQCFDPASSLQSLNSTLNSMALQMAFHVDTRNLTFIDTEIATVVNRMAVAAPAANNSLATQLAAKLASSSSCQCFDPATTLQPLNASLTGLAQQVSFHVDTRNLSVIDAQVGTVVSRMATAPASNNSLASQLGSKLSASSTCQCFDPVSLTSLNTTVLSVLANQSALASAVYVDTRNLSVLDTYVRNMITSSVQCNSLPTQIANGSVNGCFGTFNGMVCAPVCQQGFVLVNNYTCAAGTWLGSPRCDGEFMNLLCVF